MPDAGWPSLRQRVPSAPGAARAAGRALLIRWRSTSAAHTSRHRYSIAPARRSPTGSARRRHTLRRPRRYSSWYGPSQSALPAFDRISAGFPGRGPPRPRHPRRRILGTEAWHNFPLAAKLEKQLGKPARVLERRRGTGPGSHRRIRARMRADFRHRHGKCDLSRWPADAASGARASIRCGRTRPTTNMSAPALEEARCGQMEPAG